MLMIPCRECIAMAACIYRERVSCKRLKDYLIGKKEPQRTIGLIEYTTLFKCDGVTTLRDDTSLAVKAYQSAGKALPKYYFVIEPSGLHSMVREDVVMRIEDE